MDPVFTIISNCSYNKFRIATKIHTVDRFVIQSFFGPHCTGHVHVSIDAVLTYGKFKYKYLQNYAKIRCNFIAIFLCREYLRIKSVQPNPDYEGCNEFLKRQAARLELDYHITEMVPGKPIFIMTWPGTEPDLPSVLLNSHTDVVPVYEGKQSQLYIL